MRPLNILVVGAGNYVCGRGGEGFGTILPALAECHRDGLVDRLAVSATSPDSIALLGGKLLDLNSRLGTDLSLEGYPKLGPDLFAFRRALSDTKFDAAVLCTPDALHYDHASELLKAGLHCLIVKPLTPTVDEAVPLIRLAESRNLYGAVEFHKRWDEANLHVKSLLREKALGDILYVIVEYSQKRQVPSETFRSWAEESNVFQYLGVHYADIIHFASGARPLRAMAVGQKRWLASRGIDTWDAVQAAVEWEDPVGSRFQSVFVLNWIEPNDGPSLSRQKITLVGTAGRCESDQMRRGVEVTTDRTGFNIPNPYFAQFQPAPAGGTRFRGYGYRSVRQFVEDVSAIVDGQCGPSSFEGRRPTFRDALVSTSVVDAVNRSLESAGEWVSIPPIAVKTAARV